MAHRSTRDKQVARLRKAMRRSPSNFIDLVQWLQDHRHAQTAGEARSLLSAGKVRAGSHVVGVDEPFVRASQRAELIVLK